MQRSNEKQNNRTQYLPPMRSSISRMVLNKERERERERDGAINEEKRKPTLNRRGQSIVLERMPTGSSVVLPFNYIRTDS
jgi:hypothetical protein